MVAGAGRKRGGQGEDDGKERGTATRTMRRRGAWGQGREGKGGEGDYDGKERGVAVMTTRRRGARW